MPTSPVVAIRARIKALGKRKNALQVRMNKTNEEIVTLRRALRAMKEPESAPA